MNNTALGEENKKEQTINFISEAHEKFYYEKLKEVRYPDAVSYTHLDVYKRQFKKIQNPLFLILR